MITRNKALIHTAIEKACGGDFTKIIGLCCEASIIAFKALSDAGLSPVMVDGTFHGYVSESAKEFFKGNQHSWLVCDGVIYDPTQWVFDWENKEPAVDVTLVNNTRYKARSHNYNWLGDHYKKCLAWRGLVID